MSRIAVLGRTRTTTAMFQFMQCNLRSPICMGPCSFGPGAGPLTRSLHSLDSQLRPVYLQKQPTRALRTLGGWRPAAPLGAAAALQYAWPPAGTLAQLELCRGVKGTTNAKKKKKGQKKAKRLGYRAEAAAIAAAETGQRT